MGTIKDRVDETTSSIRDLLSSLPASTQRAILHSLASELLTFNPDSSDKITSPVDIVVSNRLEILRLKIIETCNTYGRNIITLSPLGPTGLDSYLGMTDPYKISHASGRNTDVVADPTTQLAFQISRIRKSHITQVQNLGTFARCTRLQRYANPDYTAHFEMFGTADSVIRQGQGLAVDQITELSIFYEGLLYKIDPSKSYEISLSDVRIQQELIGSESNPDRDLKRVLLNRTYSDLGYQTPKRIPLNSIEEHQLYRLFSNKFPRDFAQLVNLANIIQQKTKFAVTLDFSRLTGIGHYSGPVFAIYPQETDIDLVDGGVVDWVGRLTNNRKEKTIVSGMGTELYAKVLF